MPVYEYLCDDCGPFTALRSMDRSAEPHDCPDCGCEAPRVILSAPAFACMAPATRTAIETNERSANTPQLSTKEGRAAGHGPGCSCCGPGISKRPVMKGKDGSKAFPSARPWMISH